MGSLVTFEPISTTFLWESPFNFATLTQGDGGLSVTATSEEVNAEADRMLDDDHATAWVSVDLGGGSVVLEWDLGKLQLVDTFILGGNNLQPANGMLIEMWNDVAGSGIKVVDSGVGLDCVVRSDSDFITEDQELRLKNRLNHSPFRFTPVEVRGIRVTIDTAAGNGPDLVLEVAFTFAGLNLDVDDCLSSNNVSFEPLSRTTMSIGGGGGWTPRFPLRKNDIPLSFLLSQGSADVNALTGGPKRGLKAFFWPTPLDPNSFSASAFFGTITGSSKSQRISQGVASATIEIVEQR